jgi:predicted small lipoprotein YifL
MRAAAAALSTVALLALAGCGSKPYDLSSTTKVTPAAVKQPSADTVGTSYTVCITGIGFQTTRTDATHIQTQVPSGRIAANSTIFPTPKKAKRFDKKVKEPDHVVGGRLVTVLVPGVASPGERAALLRCAPEG